MARFCGKVGFDWTEEELDEEGNGTGIFSSNTVERVYYGDVLRNTRRWDSGTGVNDNLQINNSISILADEFVLEHMYAMKYVNWMGNFWKITNVEFQRPRLILTIGGLYNGATN